MGAPLGYTGQYNYAPAVVAKRAPASSDDIFPIGQIWIDTVGFDSYILVGFDSSGAPQWNNTSGGGGSYNTLTVVGSSTLGSSGVSTQTIGNVTAGSITQINAGGVSGAKITTGTSDNVIATQLGTALWGRQDATSPSAGYIGERIFDSVADTSAVALVDATAKTIISIPLTPGIWGIEAGILFTGTPTVTDEQVASISTTTDTLGTGGYGLDTYSNVFLDASFVLGDCSVIVPKRRYAIAANTTYYLVAKAGFSNPGSLSAYGRITAIREA